MRVVVLGAGYAGLVLARALEDTLPEAADLVVVDEHDYHLVQHELHRVVRRPGFADEIAIPLADLLDRATLRRARVERVDPGDRTVELAGGEVLSYDVAAVCLGAETEFYGLPGVAEHATPLKRLEHARAVRAGFLDALATGEDATVVVGGAGLSGVQLAGELAALAREEDADDRVEVVLVEQFDDVAPGFRADFQAAVRGALERRGVTVRTGVAVECATDEAVHLDGRGPLAYDQLVWTGGIRGTGALDGERPTVRATLALDDRTFVLGDAARVVDAEGSPVPASAQAAVAGARTAARNVARVVDAELEGEVFAPRLDQFRFDGRGWLVSVGDGAVAQVGPSVFTGRAARALKSSVGVGYLATAGAVRDAVEVVREEFWPESEA